MKGKMNMGKIIAGLILLVIAIWLFVYQTDTTAKYVGSAIGAIVALALLYTGYKGK